MSSSSISANETNQHTPSGTARNGRPQRVAFGVGAAAAIGLLSLSSPLHSSASSSASESAVAVADPAHHSMKAMRSGGQPYAIPAPGIGQGISGYLPESTPIKTPSGDNTGNFRVVCHYSHMNYDDAIIYPGQPGAAHMHTYFGNLNADASSTGASLLGAGNSTCDGGIANRSAYWVPSIIDATGTAVVPDYNMVYYKSGYQGALPGDIVDSFPIGLKMLTGDMKATAPQGAESWDRNINWSCSTDGWQGRKAYIPDCGEGNEIVAEIQFPQCWDGVNLDSPDHRSHVAFGQWGVGCPATHPVALPSISYNIHYKVPAAGTTGWRLSSDMYSDGPGGYSLHADIITAWDPAFSDVWLANCVNKNADCNVAQMTDDSRLIWGVK
jgi:Domain of unknown function (DUF1996)